MENISGLFILKIYELLQMDNTLLEMMHEDFLICAKYLNRPMTRKYENSVDFKQYYEKHYFDWLSF